MNLIKDSIRREEDKMKKPFKNTEVSNKRCNGIGCNKLLKKNLLAKKPEVKFCYRCWYPMEMKRRGINVRTT